MLLYRQEVFEKYNRRCAYCGRMLLYKQMQVDHLHPQFLSHFQPEKDKNRIENLMPSCQKCNNHKGAMRLEIWRSELQKQVSRLKKNAQFDRALRFEQIEITEKPIVFYFEIQSEAKKLTENDRSAVRGV